MRKRQEEWWVEDYFNNVCSTHFTADEAWIEVGKLEQSQRDRNESLAVDDPNYTNDSWSVRKTFT